MWTECWIFAMSAHGRGRRQWSMTLVRPNGARRIVIWVYGADGAEEMAFTDVGTVNLIELIKIHKGNPDILAGRR